MTTSLVPRQGCGPGTRSRLSDHVSRLIYMEVPVPRPLKDRVKKPYVPHSFVYGGIACKVTTLRTVRSRYYGSFPDHAQTLPDASTKRESVCTLQATSGRPGIEANRCERSSGNLTLFSVERYWSCIILMKVPCRNSCLSLILQDDQE